MELHGLSYRLTYNTIDVLNYVLGRHKYNNKYKIFTYIRVLYINTSEYIKKVRLLI